MCSCARVEDQSISELLKANKLLSLSFQGTFDHAFPFHQVIGLYFNGRVKKKKRPIDHRRLSLGRFGVTKSHTSHMQVPWIEFLAHPTSTYGVVH